MSHFVICLVTIGQPQIIVLNLEIHKWEDELQCKGHKHWDTPAWSSLGTDKVAAHVRKTCHVRKACATQEEDEEEELYMLQPANKSDRMCHLLAMTMRSSCLSSL